MDFQWNKLVPGCVQTIKDANGKVVDQVSTLNCVPAVFSNVLTGLLMLAGTFALFLFIFSAYKYINSGGDAKRLEGARGTLIQGILGLLVVLFSFLIIQIISNVANVPCIRSFGFGCN